MRTHPLKWLSVLAALGNLYGLIATGQPVYLFNLGFYLWLACRVESAKSIDRIKEGDSHDPV